jgi:hypothetical protein
MKLGTGVVCAKVADKADGTGVQWRGAHVLALPRPRLPHRHLFIILEPRLQHIHGTPPGVSIDNGAEGQL